MKKSICLPCVMVCIAGFFFGCERSSPELPKKNGSDTYADVMIQYFPYDINEHFVFENNQTEDIKECYAFNYNNRYGAIYPLMEKRNVNPNDSSISAGDWQINIDAPMIAADNDPIELKYDPGFITFRVFGSTFDSACNVNMHTKLQFNAEEYFYGSLDYRRFDTSKVLSLFMDTITIPLTQHVLQTKREPISEGAYVHIVKNIGITDFSIDGKSIWKRKFE